MKYIVCLNQKSVIFILLLNSTPHSSGDTLNLEPSEKSWLIKPRGCAGEQECTAGHWYCAFEANSWGLALGCQAALFKLLCYGIAGNPNHK